MNRLLERFVVFVDDVSSRWYWTVHDEAARIRRRRWLERMRRTYPVGSLVRCRCPRCAGGPLWRIHGYDPDSEDLRAYDGAVGLGPLLEPWPLGTAFRTAFLSELGRDGLELLELVTRGPEGLEAAIRRDRGVEGGPSRDRSP